MTLTNAIRQFLEYCEVERGRSPATIRMYSFVLERFQQFAEKQRVTEVRLITLDLVRKFRLWLHRRPGRNDETVSPATQNLHLVVIRSFLKYLAKRDIVSLASEKIELAKTQDREVEFLEPEEMDRLLAAPMSGIAVAKTPREGRQTSTASLLALRDKAVLEVLFSTGMRVG
ncbi:MAG: site-specific integrase, partial [Candidatus Uhrbacteria bacterium]